MSSAVLSKVSSKGQTVLPKVIRDRLGIKPGDVLAFRVTGKAVTIEKVVTGDGDDPFATFDEWRSDEDEQLYRDL